jgi:hypothetical protein
MTRNPFLLAGVFVALVGAIVLFVLSGRQNPAGKREGAGLLYPDLDTARVDRIELRTPRASVDLFRDGALWRAAREDSFPADPDAVQKILDAAKNLNARDIISRNAEKYAVFEVDSAKGVDVRLSAGGKEAAHFVVGRSGSGFQSTYVRDASRREVFQQAAPLKTVFDRGTRSWKDKAVFRLEEEKMLAVELERKGETIRLERLGEAGWSVASPVGYRAKGAMGEALARGLTRLTATDVAPAADAEKGLFETPEAIVRVDMRDGPDPTLLVGAEKEGGAGRYVRRESDGVVFVVPVARLANYVKPSEELIEPAPPDSSLKIPPGAGGAEGGEAGHD